MDGGRKIHLSEGVPLNSSGANIFLNSTIKSPKVNSPDGTIIHLKPAEQPSDLGVHINTTFSIASSSKKIKLLFVLNFLLSVLGMVISCSVAFYCWNEMISMRRQLDLIKDHISMQSISQQKLIQSPLVTPPRLQGLDFRRARMDLNAKDDTVGLIPRRYYVEDLGEDMLLVDSKKKNPSIDSTPVYDLKVSPKEDVLVAHFNGDAPELYLGSEPMIGPWVRDTKVSSKNSEGKIEFADKHFTVKEGGLYLVYASVAYFTKAPNCYFIWAHEPSKEARLLTTCSTGDDNSSRSLSRSQITCSVQTVTRLYKGDTINFAQREPNRTVWLLPGYSYIGFVKLSS